MSEDVSVERLSVAEAAQVLSVTRDAIHKRISRGSIDYEKGEDGRFYVYVDTPTETLDSSTDSSKDESKVEALERILEHQQDRIAFLERELERRGDETERLHQIVAGLTRATAELSARLPELEAPVQGGAPREPRERPVSPGPIDTLTDATDAGRGPQTASERPQKRRGFLSRLLGG